MTDQYQVSRGTLRYALKNLQGEGIIRAVPGYGYLITERVIESPKVPVGISVGILIGARTGNQESRTLPWIPALQQRVAKRGWTLHIHEGIPEISRSPAAGLKKLFHTSRHSCWLLIRCPERVQKEIIKQKIPAIICGSPFDGIDLPSIDLNYQAIGRHAAGLLVSKGHKRIGYVRSRTLFPGDRECFNGFRETIEKSSIKPTVKVIRFPSETHDYKATIRQVKNTSHPITALFVDCPFQYLGIFTQALQAGISIPEELSMICRHDSDFLQHLNPLPACYTFHARERAQKIHHALEARIQGDTMRGHRTLLIPEFIPGNSVASV